VSPKVTVIIPTYNRAHLIGETLASVQAQDFRDYEILVVDDGSTDNTHAVVAGVAPEARYLYQENMGIPGVLNVCVRESRGAYIQHLGSDDLLTPGSLARSVAVLDANPAAGLVHGAAWLIDDAGRRLSVSRPAFARGDYVRSGREEIRDLLFTNHVVATTVVARREAMLEAGLFDDRFGLYEDWNLWTRIARKHDIAYIHEPQACYRVHLGPSGSIFQKATTREIDRFRRMHLDEVLNDPALRDEFAPVKREALARHHLVVGRRACEGREMWYARREALLAALWRPSAAPAAAALFARTLVPDALAGWARRRRAGRAAVAAAGAAE
jgi:glycosyltransferase involved in cell wall biosynthesis